MATIDPNLVSDETLAAEGFDLGSPALEAIHDPDTRAMLLRAFREEHRESTQIIRESILTGDRTAARDLLHKLMGSTATIGAVDLRQAVLDVQARVRTTPPSVDATTLNRFGDEFARVITLLDKLG